MKKSLKLWLASWLAATVVIVTGCGGGGGGGGGDGFGSAGGSGLPPGSATSSSVLDSAASTVDSFIAFLKGLDPNDERSEPLLIRDSFAVPPDEVNESQPLT